MQFGSAGAGAATHLGCVLLNYVIGTDITHVPYRGTGPAMQDLLAGRIDFLCEVITTAKPQIDGGTVKALAIFHKERSPARPMCPPPLEQGTRISKPIPGTRSSCPRTRPTAIVKRLNDAAVQTIKSPSVRDRLSDLGAQIVSDDRATSAYLGQFVREEIEKWAAPIKASGVIVE